MRKIIKGIVGRTWKPFVEWYLRKPRSFNYHGITLTVLPQVFHPGFFFSTKLMAAHLEKQDLSGKQLLEIGCGSGLLSILSAQRNAIVTATDISPVAVHCTVDNSKINHVNLTVLESNLFRSIPVKQFDFIIVNPPYFKKNPDTMAENAWYCGENLEYFHNFFQQSHSFIHKETCIKMVLSDECDLHGIQAIADENNFQWELDSENRTFWEIGYIFNIRPMKEGKL